MDAAVQDSRQLGPWGSSKMDAREQFFGDLRRALGRPSGPGPELTLSEKEGADSIEARAQEVLREAEARSDELMSELEESAAQIGWTVARVKSPEQAVGRIEALVRSMEPRSAMRSTHPVLERLRLEPVFAGMGVDLTTMSADKGEDPSELEQLRASLREKAIHADIGLTGVDYAIAETGSCVLLARRGVSRLVSLLPPIHVAVVEKGQVLPSLDELFTLRRHAFLGGDGGSYMNIISGPSRSADIEQTLVTGVHGPREAHLVLLG